MCFAVFRSSAIATLVLLSQITPALLCIFKQLPPSAVIKTPTYPIGSPFVKHDLGDCMEMCYQNESCVYVISYKSGLCSANPSEGKTMRADEMRDSYGNHGVVYQLDRNAPDAQCPWLGEWLEESR